MTMYLGIDYGRAHLGVAYAEHSLATPLLPLKNDQAVIAKLSQLITTHQITHLILGLPTGPLTAEVHAFKKLLSRKLKIKVTFHDETLSTHEAIKQLIASGSRQKKRRNEHSYAAALILEDYLESAKLKADS